MKRAETHVAPTEPFAEQSWNTHQDSGCDLYRLQHNPVCESVGGADAVGAGENGNAGGLENANVGRCRRDQRRHVDSQQHGGGGTDAGAAVEPDRRQEQVTSEGLKCPSAELSGERQ